MNMCTIPYVSVGPEKFRGCFERLPFFDAALYPNFVDTLLLPVGKQADAVGAGLDGVKVVSHFTERQVFIHILSHNEGWLDIECDLCDNAKCPKSNHGASKRFAVYLTGQLTHFAGCRDDFQCRHCRRCITIFLAC